MTDDALIAFLNARLNEDEAAAVRAAECEKLRVVGEERGLAPGDWSWLASYGEPQPGDIALIDHQVRFDPARVLREIAAKRTILAAHPLSEVWENQRAGRAVSFGCKTCHIFDGVLEAFGYCVTLLALPVVYSDHPDYKPEWKPELAVWIP